MRTICVWLRKELAKLTRHSWQRRHLTSCPQGWVIGYPGQGSYTHQRFTGRAIKWRIGIWKLTPNFSHLCVRCSLRMVQWDGVGLQYTIRSDDAWWHDWIGKCNGRGGHGETFPPLCLLLSTTGNLFLYWWLFRGHSLLGTGCAVVDTCLTPVGHSWMPHQPYQDIQAQPK